MKGINIKEEFMQKTMVVWLGALLCCLLWGSAFPCIKIGYRLFEINSADTATQILFAGCRFALAGVLAVIIGSFMEGRILLPEKKATGKILWLSMLQTIIQYFFLCRTGTYQWGKSFYYRGGKCVCCDPCGKFSVSSGKDHFQEDHRLCTGICRSGTYQSERNESPVQSGWRRSDPSFDSRICFFFCLCKKILERIQPGNVKWLSVYCGWTCSDGSRRGHGRQDQQSITFWCGASCISCTGISSCIFSLGNSSEI